MGRYLVTGGAGFIGSNFIRSLLAGDPAAVVLNLDLLTYAGSRKTADELATLDRCEFVRGDIRDRDLVDQLMATTDVVINLAAESHVDRSIADQTPFLSTNVVGTGVLLDSARAHGVGRFIHVSTDEVYGPIAIGSASEGSRLDPSSPYAASKASADLVVSAHATTYGYQAIVTRCTNNYGPRQHPEKLIPLAITRALEGGIVPIYGDGAQERDWLWVDDHCSALGAVVEAGEPGEVYNISADAPAANLDLANRIIEHIGSGSIQQVADRPGHDRRYALDSSKLRSLGWMPTMDLDEGIARTVDWYRANAAWWRPLVEHP